MKSQALQYASIWDRLLLFKPSPPLVAITAAVLTLLVGKIDLDTGTTVSLSLLYLIPIALGSCFGSKLIGILTAVFAAVVWHLAEHGTAGSGLTPILNLCVRMITFASFAWLLAEVRALNLKLKYGLDRKTASLEREQWERRRVEQQFETFFELCEDVFCICDYGNNLEVANGAWTHLTEQQKLEGRKLLDFIHPDDVGHVSLVLQEIRDAGGTGRFKARVIRPNGTIQTLEWTITASQEGRKLFIVAHDMTERLKMEREILEVSDREGQRIGQDLHDSLCQRLKGLGMIAEATRNSSATQPAFYQARADKLATELNRAIHEVRNVARGLYPVHVDSGGLKSALLELASSTRELFNIDCRATVDESAASIDNASAVHLYRIAQEAVSNATRHGKAKCIMVALTGGEGQTKLSIRDDGSGFTLDSQANGMGIHTMQYRASILNATLEIQSQPNHGTTISCILRNR